MQPQIKPMLVHRIVVIIVLAQLNYHTYSYFVGGSFHSSWLTCAQQRFASLSAAHCWLLLAITYYYYCLYDNQRWPGTKVDVGGSLIQAGLLVETSSCFRLLSYCFRLLSFYVYILYLRHKIAILVTPRMNLPISTTTGGELLKTSNIIQQYQMYYRQWTDNHLRGGQLYTPHYEY